MKRSALARGPVKLTRSTPLRSKGARKPAQRPAGEPNANGWTEEVRQAVQRRCGGNCEVRLLGCTGQATDLHHRKRRREGDHRALNALAACRQCHVDVHSSPTISRAAGWIVPFASDPAVVPVRIAGRGEVWLTEAGKYVGPGAR